MIALVWLRNPRKFTGSFPVEVSAVYDHTTDSSSMAANEFGSRMNDDICTILNWANQIRSCKCRIYYKRNVMFVRNFCNFLDIDQIGVRVSKSLNKNCFCVFLDCSFKRAFYFRIYKCCSYAIGLWKGMCQKIVCSTVDGLGSYNVFPCFCKGLECIIDSCCTGSNCKCRNSAFKSSDSLLENVLCGVGKSSVNISCIAKTKTICCML